MKYPYRLVLISNGKQKASMGFFHTELQGIKQMKKLSEESINNIKFPIRNINTTRIEEAKYELVLIKKRDENDPLVNKVRNSYGEFVDHVSNMDMWLIIDKAPYEIEEKFWVYGFHPYTDRKDFSFILNELAIPKCSKKGDFLNLKLFLNKVILQGQNTTDLVLCKNESDAIRLYNTLKEHITKNKKLKYVCFSGDCNSTRYSRAKTIEELMQVTKWNKQKIIRIKTKSQTGCGRTKKEQ